MTRSTALRELLLQGKIPPAQESFTSPHVIVTAPKTILKPPFWKMLIACMLKIVNCM